MKDAARGKHCVKRFEMASYKLTFALSSCSILATAEKLKANDFALLTINGDQQHPEGFTPLNRILEPLNILHKVVTLKDTKHNLGHYYGRSADTMLAFLAERL